MVQYLVMITEFYNKRPLPYSLHLALRLLLCSCIGYKCRLVQCHIRFDGRNVETTCYQAKINGLFTNIVIKVSWETGPLSGANVLSSKRPI